MTFALYGLHPQDFMKIKSKIHYIAKFCISKQKKIRLGMQRFLEGFRRGGIGTVPTEELLLRKLVGCLLILIQFLILNLELRVLQKIMFITT